VRRCWALWVLVRVGADVAYTIRSFATMAAPPRQHADVTLREPPLAPCPCDPCVRRAGMGGCGSHP
jgi:hypothetical protein